MPVVYPELSPVLVSLSLSGLQKSASGSGRTSIDASDADVAVHSTTKEEDAELERGFIRPEAEFEQLTKAALRNNRLIFARLKLKQDPCECSHTMAQLRTRPFMGLPCYSASDLCRNLSHAVCFS
jgi:hypothetical protein